MLSTQPIITFVANPKIKNGIKSIRQETSVNKANTFTFYPCFPTINVISP